MEDDANSKLNDVDERSTIVSVLAALVANALIGIIKLVAAAISSSVSMASEGIHSFVDCGNELLLMIGIRESKKPANYMHPFGWGKSRFFWSMIVALLIFLLGGGISIYQGVTSIVATYQGTAEHIEPLINYIVITIAMALEGTSWFIAVKQFNKVRGKMRPLKFIKRETDPSLYTVVLEDTAAELGLLLALLGNILSQVTGNTYFDGIASILIGLLLCSVSLILLVETKGLLIGEGAGHAITDKVRGIVESNKCVHSCGRVLSMYVGPDSLLFAIDATFKKNYSTVDILNAIDNIERNIHLQVPNTGKIFIEVESLGRVNQQQREEQEWEEED